LRAAGLVGGNHLTIEDRLVDAKLGHDVVTEGRGDLLAQHIEPREDIPSSRDEAAAPALDIAQRAKPIVFRIEQPVGVVERLLAPGWRDRLYPRKCHCGDIDATRLICMQKVSSSVSLHPAARTMILIDTNVLLRRLDVYGETATSNDAGSQANERRRKRTRWGSRG
jgi:hypothetical protein